MQRLLADVPVAFDSHAVLTELVRRDVAAAIPSLVLLDVDLVEQSAEALLQVQQRFPQAPLLAVGHGLTGDRSATLLVHGIPSLCKPLELAALAKLIARLATDAHHVFNAQQRSERETSAAVWREHLSHVLRTYASRRGLSAQQQLILHLYLAGDGDKEIATACGCSLSTVYEHWRRMARKVGGSCKQHVIADFHRFLAGG